MQKMGNKIRTETGSPHVGFVDYKANGNAIFTVDPN